MFKILKSQKDSSSVTDIYLNIILKACKKAGFVAEYTNSDKAFNKKNDFIITDNIFYAFHYLKKGFHNNMVWLQGIIPEESYMRNRSKIRFFILSKIEKYVLKKANFLFLVSKSMQDHYEKKYNLDLEKKSFIMPCFNEIGVNKSVFSNPQKYKNNTFVFIGGLQVWQSFEKTVKLYSEIEKRTDFATKFYVFTPKKEAAQQILQKYTVKNYEIDCVGKQELSKRIKDIKYGFVLRENNIVNNVATPTKISNYLSNGIIPIYSPAVKDFYEFQKQNDLGIVCNLDDLENGIENILGDMKTEYSCDDVFKKCENVFKEYYNKDFYISKIAEKLKSFNN